ncbi:MAG: flagellar basal body-associated FliL family protein [Stellaceae bacterium]
MADIDSVAAVTVKTGRAWAAFRSWKMIAVLVIGIAACAAAAYWFLAPRQAASVTNNRGPDLPLYLEIKPFVVSIANDAGSPHFVQLGINLAVSGKDVGNAITGILPEIQDAMRQTALGFKVEDIVTPAGVDKLRQAMLAAANRLLVQRLSAEEVKRLSGSQPNGQAVQNVFFSTLIVE